MKKTSNKVQKKLSTHGVEETKKTVKNQPQTKTAAKSNIKEVRQTKTSKDVVKDVSDITSKLNTGEQMKKKEVKETPVAEVKNVHEEIKMPVSTVTHQDKTKIKKPADKVEKKQLESEAPKMDEDTPDMDQMMADIMGGFSSLKSKTKETKTKRQKLPFIPSLEVKTSREIIRELNNAIDMKDKPLQLSLLKGLEEHTEMAKEERINYLEQETKLAIELGHDDTAINAAENLLKLDPFNVSGSYHYLHVML